MKVREVQLRNVMSHADTHVVFPEVGLVVVTGPNGAGKSSLVEGVALAVYGKTLRGTPGWMEGAKTSLALVRTDALIVERSRRGSKATLAWEPDERTEEGRAVEAAARLSPGQTDFAWESTTHAQTALDRLVPPFDVWRRGCAFSASDAAHFSTASDGERKRLLESILGLSRFDPALERCRRDLRGAEAGEARHSGAVLTKRAAIEQAERRLRDAEAVLAEAVTGALQTAVDGSRREERQRLRRFAEQAREDIRRLESLLRGHERAGGEHEAEARGLRAALARVEGGRCPSCEQPVPEAYVSDLRSRVEAAAREFAAARTEAARQRLLADGQLQDLRGELDVLVERERALEREEAADAARREEAERAATRRSRAERTVEEARRELEDLRSALAAMEAEHARAKHRVALLSSVEGVLGLKGVRAHVLTRSLAGLEAVSNAWLPRLGLPDLRLRLRPYAEKKTGGVSDSIAVEVSGAGGGHGYKAASAGERRRIDVSLLVAVSEVSGAAFGWTGSTLWFDEVFDGLDADGTEAVALALAELARDRVVVVVTHSKDLAEKLPTRLRLRVERGRVVDCTLPEVLAALDAVERLDGDPGLVGAEDGREEV